jgi:hypothetical protein
MSDYDLQYRPLATVETAADDALSVRARDLIKSANNAKLVHAPRISDAWPEIYSGGTQLISNFGDTTENLIGVWPRIFVGNGFNRIHWTISAVRTNGASTIIWKLYWSWKAYTGATTSIAAADLATMGVSLSSSLTVNSDTDDLYTDLTLAMIPPSNGFIYYTLTATNGNATTDGCLYSIAITPWRSDA